MCGAARGDRLTVEVDFVAERGDTTEYFQVSESILDPATRERRLRPLFAIRDANPKYLLTRDYSTARYDGVQHINVLQWLLGET